MEVFIDPNEKKNRLFLEYFIHSTKITTIDLYGYYY